MTTRDRKKREASGTNARQQSRFRLQLRGKLILAYLIIALVPLVALTGVIIMLTQNEVTALIDTTLDDQAGRIADSIGRSIGQLTKDLGGLAVNPSIEQMVVIRPTNIVREKGLEDKTIEEMEAIMDETRNLETNARTQEFLQATVADFGTFSELIVVNLDGMVVGATARPDRFIHINEPWFQYTLENNTYIGDIQKLPGREEPGVVIATVINRSSTGRPAGIIRGLVPLQYFTDSLLPIVDRIGHGELQLLIGGEVVAVISNDGTGTALSVFLEGKRPSPIALGAEGGFGQNSLGEESIASFAGLSFRDPEAEGFDWEIRIAQPTAYALALTQELTSIGTIGTVLTAVLVALAALLFANSISGPIKGLTAHAQGVAEGHLRQYRPKRLANDETGALAEAFNGMTAQLARLLHRIRKASGELATSSQEISAGMEEMAAGTQNQSQDIQSGTEQIEEMNQAMLAIDARAGEALELSRNASEEAANGRQQAQAAVEGMNHIKTSVDSLGEQTEEIATILGLIQEIAEQTNLLALNAAIEAARAGEQGRSFAVVAQEVGELAARSQKATAEIDEVLRRIRSETLRSISSVEEGQKQVFEVEKALEEIARATKDTEALIQQIARESIEETGRTKEAVALFESIGLVTEQTAAGAEETAASAQNLAELAQQLQDLIVSFQSS